MSATIRGRRCADGPPDRLAEVTSVLANTPMRIQSFLALALLFMGVGVAAAGIALLTQPFVQAVTSQPPQVNVKRLEAHVRHLSVNLYPRSFDQLRNIDLAAQYILR